MIRLLATRIGLGLATWFIAVSLMFVAMRWLPGNPLLARFGQHPDPEQIEQLRREQGWDRPLPLQLTEFFGKLIFQGDLGVSAARNHVRISDELAQRIPATVELTFFACLISIPLGIVAGVVSAVWRGKFPDLFCMAGALVGVSIPVFFLGIVLRGMCPFLPTAGRMSATVFGFQPLTGLFLCDTLLRGRFDLFGDALRHLTLPAVTLSSVPMAIIARITRSSMLEVLHADYIRTAKAKGASLWRVIWRHAFPNAAVPVTNIAGLQIGLLLSGAILTETIFDWPGLGQYVAAAVVRDHDYIAVQGGAVVITALFVVMNLLLDVTYLWLEPRLRDAH